ncbi:hypothetical protein [Sphingomonas sp. ACRSK]|uniref:hypothetical protein n=1 Tax=Sphingomonas sp. ACRSK TaxID=2918213 RepID=UPI001EF58BD0|nr:hypothetical protein [Sphingomonas sp. ACRSK]MCG7347840.1 hypothetical protein [Sphingomonas sp. ACRSK]
MAVILMLVVLLALPFLFIAALIFAARTEARRDPWRFRITDVVSQSFSTIGRARLPMLATSLVTIALPATALQTALGFDATARMFTMPDEQVLTALGIGWLVSLLVGTLGEVVMIAIALDVLAGRPVQFGPALAQGLRLLLPAILVRLLLWVGVALGLMLFIIPGLVLMLTWAIVLPVLVAERPGIFASFARSGELLRGARWRLLLLFAIVFVAWSLFGGMGQGFALASQTSGARIGSIVIQTLVATLTGAMGAAGLSTIYHQLKSEREGLVGEDLEAVFA